MRAFVLSLICLAHVSLARRVHASTSQQSKVSDDAVRKLATVLMAFNMKPLGAANGHSLALTRNIGRSAFSRSQMSVQESAAQRLSDIMEMPIDTLRLYRDVKDLCRDEESNGCDLELIEALRTLPDLMALKRTGIISSEIQELCRDDESSGCDLDMIEALSTGFLSKEVQELCRDDESTGCDLEMIEALKMEMIEKVGHQLKVTVPTVEKLDDYGLPA
mmetsp:Transcript_27023/g.49541  ORF Transcript_27023/g.49541 Transcript_27023/m.49541 type:complete len:219 (-) Transcript_27023:20-676(-)